jgi:hypothetical protein
MDKDILARHMRMQAEMKGKREKIKNSKSPLF